MVEIFLELLNMSISAFWLIAAVLLVRLLLKKAPKWINVLLWGIVAVRLICPFTFESALSLIPSAQTVSPQTLIETPEINVGIPIVDNTVNPVLEHATTANPEASVYPFELIILSLSIIWAVGVAVMVCYGVISYLLTKRKISTAVLLRDNIYQSEKVSSPFVFGIIKPEIYLPFNISENDARYVIAHEEAHIRRKDYLWKPLGFMILALHWFNPLVWLAYIFLCRDIELACDEKVVAKMTNEQKADYSQALLLCSVSRRAVAACPVAFGEVGVKERVKSVLNYKKPAFWVVIVAVAVSVALAVCFLTNPETGGYKEYYDSGYSLQVYVEKYKGTTQLPDSTETLFFDVQNGTKGTLYNGTKFEITECNLQEGKLTVKLSGTPLYDTEQVEHELVKEIVIEQGTNGVFLTSKNYMDFITFSLVENKETLDEAVSKAIFAENKLSYYDVGTECAGEGHIIYGTEVKGNEYRVYAWTEYYLFGFENGYFMAKGGGSLPAVMTFEKTADGYTLLDAQYPMDGSYYPSSIKRMFPKEYVTRVLNPTKSDTDYMWKQCEAYAQAYLDKIGRTEEIRTYGQVKHTLFTDVGISVEVSNKVLEYGLPYNYYLGYFESLEDGVRYIYRTSYNKKHEKIVFTKENYDTEAVIEKIEIDALTGEMFS